MPALPNIPQTLRISCSGTVDGIDAWLSRFHVLYAGTAPTDAQATTFATAVATAWNAQVASVVATTDALTGVEVTDLSSPIAAQGFWVGSHAGGVTGTTLPGDTALLASYEITRRYRGGHPRGYWRAGVAANLADSGHWSGAFVTAAQSAMTAFFTAVSGAGWSGAGAITHCSVSYYKGFEVIINPVTGRARNVPKVKSAPDVDVVVGVVVRPAVGSQRRRQRL